MNRLQDVKAGVGNFGSGTEVMNISWTINTRDSKNILDNKFATSRNIEVGENLGHKLRPWEFLSRFLESRF